MPKAWTCHGRNQRDLVDRLVRANIIRTDSVRDVLSKVDRKYYAPASDVVDAAYLDMPLSIGMGQTISAPHMHAHVLEEMYPFLKASNHSSLKILDVGCGSGYLTAALGRWVAPLLSSKQQHGESNDSKSGGSILDKSKTGHVYGIDVYPYLVKLSQSNMEKGDKDLLDNSIVQLKVSDGWKGLPEAGPFDAIHVGAAAVEFPKPLMEQLAVGGVLIVPVGPEGGTQNLYRVERSGDGLSERDFKFTESLGVRYVPLVQQKEEY